MEKREATITFKVTEFEAVVLRQLAADFDMDLSELVRTSLAFGLPILQNLPFARRIRLEDNSLMDRKQ